jgi:hypothetical protein
MARDKTTLTDMMYRLASATYNTVFARASYLVAGGANDQACNRRDYKDLGRPA